MLVILSKFFQQFLTCTLFMTILSNSNHTPRKLQIDVSLCTSALTIDIGPFTFKHLKTYL